MPGKFCIALIKPYKLVNGSYMWVTKIITPLAPGIAFTSLLKLTPSMFLQMAQHFVVNTISTHQCKTLFDIPSLQSIPRTNQAHCNLLAYYGMEFFLLLKLASFQI